MCKLVNRIKYGKSQTPRFITSQDKWLYKNKWISSQRAYEILSDNRVGYTYSLIKGEYASFGELQSFDEVVSMTNQYPTEITFPDLSQFSMQEVNIILGIQKKHALARQAKFMESVEKAEAELRSIKF